MTERIDLDELKVDSDAAENRDRPHHGDWFWRGTGDPEDEPDEATASAIDTGETTPDSNRSTDAETCEWRDSGGDEETNQQPLPRVPRVHDGKPVGIPAEKGGAGGGTDADRSANRGSSEDDDARSQAGMTSSDDSDGMTTAITYEALQRLADPQRVFADASSWSDWLGIVGDVDAHVINKFQRDHALDVDFFNGSGTGPGERLAGIDHHSMFYADRMVLVGLDGRDEHIAETAGWEFVSLAEAAEKADWERTDG